MGGSGNPSPATLLLSVVYQVSAVKSGELLEQGHSTEDS